MRRLLILALLLASTVFGQAPNGWQPIENGWNEIQTAASSGLTAATCTVAGYIPYVNAANDLACEAGFSYNAATNVLTATTFSGTSLSVGLGGTAHPTALTVGDTATTSPRGIMSWQSSTGTDGAHIHLRKSRGTFASPTTIVTGDTIGRLVGSGYDGTGFLEMAGINFLSTGTIGTNRVPTKIEFQTATDAAPSVLTTALTLNEKQQALFTDGTTALPSISFPSDPDTGFLAFGSGTTVHTANGTATTAFTVGGINMNSIRTIGWAPSAAGAAAVDTLMSRRAAATLQLGAADAAAPVAQTLTVQGSRGGTDTNTAGVDWTHTGSLGTGTAASGKMIFNVGTPQASGTTQHVAAAALTLQNAGSAGTAAPQALFADGTAAAPSMAFSGSTGTGTYRSGTSIVFSGGGTAIGSFTSSGVSAAGYGIQNSTNPLAQGLRFFNDGQIRWTATGATDDDLFIRRRAAATLQLGAADAAAPVAQTLAFQGSRGATDTNVAGVVATVQGSLGTGTAVAGPISIRTGYPTATGTTQHVASTRSYMPGAWTTLTESTPTAIATLTFGASSWVGGEWLVTVAANDATDFQAVTYRVVVNSVRKATGNTVSTVAATADAAAAASSGTLTATFTVTEGASAAVLNCSAVSSLTQTTLQATWQSLTNGPNLVLAQN